MEVFDYLRATVQNVKAVGPSQIEPFFGKTLLLAIGPPFGVHGLVPRFSHFLHHPSAEDGLLI